MIALPNAILWPVALHLVLVLCLLSMVSFTRMRAVRRGEVAGVVYFSRKDVEPDGSRRYVANLNNQFEMPTFFYALIALLYAADAVTGSCSCRMRARRWSLTPVFGWHRR